MYNDAIDARKTAHRVGERYPSTAELDKRLITEAKRRPERSWLAEVSTVPLQQALRDCHSAYTNFFESLAGKRSGSRMGPPTFKRRLNTQTARYTRRGFKLKVNGRLHIAKVGEVKVAWSRLLPSEPSSVTMIKTPTGKYYASFVVAMDGGADLPNPLADSNAETGIDLGLKDFAVLRDGKTMDSPKFFRSMERKLKKTQRDALGRFLTLLESKAHRAGRTFVRVDRYFPSTRLCSACGALTGPQGLEGLKIRSWECGCGAVHDRDANAEVNIRREGRRLVAAGLADTRNACGAQVRPV